jgi:hypothetical protein
MNACQNHLPESADHLPELSAEDDKAAWKNWLRTTSLFSAGGGTLADPESTAGGPEMAVANESNAGGALSRQPLPFVTQRPVFGVNCVRPHTLCKRQFACALTSPG